MACPVCNEEERFLIADFEDFMMMGYIYGSDPEMPGSCAYLDIYMLPKEDNDADVYHHRQIVSTCPICGRQLVEDDIKNDVISFYNELHEKRIELQNTISGQ